MTDRPTLQNSGVVQPDQKWADLLADDAAIGRMVQRLMDEADFYGRVWIGGPWGAMSIVERLIAAAAEASLKPASD